MTSPNLRSHLVILFCLWHMSAIGLYVLPNNLSEPLPSLQKVTKPYVRLLSQWQQWNIFSPDPLRTINSATVMQYAGDRWEPALSLDFDHLPWWKRARELKILERINGDWDELAGNYLLSLCPELPSGGRGDIQLLVRSWTLPRELTTLRHFANANPAESGRVIATARCPSVQ